MFCAVLTPKVGSGHLPGNISRMANVLLATDADWLYDEVDAALGSVHQVFRVREGAHVPTAMGEVDPDLVMLDLQIGNMGGMATSLLVKQEGRQGRLPAVPVVMLLDRAADDFLATQSEADAWLVKPLDAFGIRRTTNELLAAAADRDDVDESSEDSDS